MRLLRFIFGTGTNHIPVEPGSPRSFSLSLAFSDLADAIPLLDDISTGIDCWEVRADCFPPTLDASEIAYQLALLRRQSDLPILFAVRTRSQGGRFPDLMGGAEYPLELQLASQRRLHDLVMLAYRVGCEYVDLELVWPESVLVSLIANRGNTKVIGSWYDRVGRYSWTGREMREIHERGARLGVDFIKIVNTARRSEDNITLRAFVDQTATRGIPLIAINDGTEVRISLATVLVAVPSRLYH
jgi:pentafunctional AROM polypeptide